MNEFKCNQCNKMCVRVEKEKTFTTPNSQTFCLKEYFYCPESGESFAALHQIEMALKKLKEEK